MDFLKRAIEKSKESAAAGNFPAGAVVVKGGEVLAEAVSSPYPGLYHADGAAIGQAYSKHGPLTGASLYVGLEPCLMCTSIAYWAGIRDIYFAVPKSKVSRDYYETHADTSTLPKSFNEPMNLHHVAELEEEALAVIKEWENKQ
jgi:tRNA(Arg) A34 adenosine deaminase TadA